MSGSPGALGTGWDLGSGGTGKGQIPAACCPTPPPGLSSVSPSCDLSNGGEAPPSQPVASNSAAEGTCKCSWTAPSPAGTARLCSAPRHQAGGEQRAGWDLGAGFLTSLGGLAVGTVDSYKCLGLCAAVQKDILPPSLGNHRAACRVVLLEGLGVHPGRGVAHSTLQGLAVMNQTKGCV